MARILVVDDEEPVRKMLSAFLSDRGHTVETAAGGKAGLEVLRRGAVDLVLLDINMPDMNGIETLRRILAEDPRAAVIMISGAGDETLARRALEMGAFDYIEKPFDIDYLEKVVILKITTRP
jgi:DNA-binding response OmpR family regulator